MKKYIYVNADGFARFETDLQDGEVPPAVAGLTPVLADSSPPQAPDAIQQYHLSTSAWADPRTLDQHKLAANERINNGRLRADTSSFAYAGKAIAVNAKGRSDIDGINGYAALNGALPANWPGGWKAVDNSYVPIADLAGWKSFYNAMVDAGNANFAHAQQLKATLAQATTAAQADAVNW